MGWCFSSYWVGIKGIRRIEKNWALENLAGWGLDNLTIGGFKVHSWGLRQMVCLAFISTACDDDDMDNMNDMDDMDDMDDMNDDGNDEVNDGYDVITMTMMPMLCRWWSSTQGPPAPNTHTLKYTHTVSHTVTLSPLKYTHNHTWHFSSPLPILHPCFDVLMNTIEMEFLLYLEL